MALIFHQLLLFCSLIIPLNISHWIIYRSCSLKVFVPITIIALLLLIPVNVSDGTLSFLKKDLVTSDIDKLSISNVRPKSVRYVNFLSFFIIFYFVRDKWRNRKLHGDKYFGVYETHFSLLGLLDHFVTKDDDHIFISWQLSQNGITKCDIIYWLELLMNYGYKVSASKIASYILSFFPHGSSFFFNLFCIFFILCFHHFLFVF